MKPRTLEYWNEVTKRRCRYCGSRECPNHDHCRDTGKPKCEPATCPNGKCRSTNECVDDS